PRPAGPPLRAGVGDGWAEATVLEGLDSIEAAQVRRCARVLLRRPLLRADGPEGEVLPAVRRYTARLPALFAGYLGYRPVGGPGARRGGRAVAGRRQAGPARPGGAAAAPRRPGRAGRHRRQRGPAGRGRRPGGAARRGRGAAAPPGRRAAAAVLLGRRAGRG